MRRATAEAGDKRNLRRHWGRSRNDQRAEECHFQSSSALETCLWDTALCFFSYRNTQLPPLPCLELPKTVDIVIGSSFFRASRKGNDLFNGVQQRKRKDGELFLSSTRTTRTPQELRGGFSCTKPLYCLVTSHFLKAAWCRWAGTPFFFLWHILR